MQSACDLLISSSLTLAIYAQNNHLLRVSPNLPALPYFVSDYRHHRDFYPAFEGMHNVVLRGENVKINPKIEKEEEEEIKNRQVHRRSKVHDVLVLPAASSRSPNVYLTSMCRVPALDAYQIAAPCLSFSSSS